MKALVDLPASQQLLLKIAEMISQSEYVNVPGADGGFSSGRLLQDIDMEFDRIYQEAQKELRIEDDE